VTGGQVELFAETRMWRREGELEALQVLYVQVGNVRQGMVVGRQQHNVLVEQRAGPQLRVRQGHIDDGAVDGAVGEQHA